MNILKALLYIIRNRRHVLSIDHDPNTGKSYYTKDAYYQYLGYYRAMYTLHACPLTRRLFLKKEAGE